MKFGIRAGLGLLSFAVATTFFTGCGADSVPTSAPVDDTHTLDQAIKPQTPDVKDKFTKWIDATQNEQKTAETAQKNLEGLTKTDQNLYGIYDVYERDGTRFILSGDKLVTLNEDGLIPASARDFLRMPGSNQRVYVMDSENYRVTKEIYDKYSSIVESSAAINFEDRNSSEDYISTPSRMFRDLVVNGMYQYGENTNVISPPEDVLAEGCAFNLNLLLEFFEQCGIVSELDKNVKPSEADENLLVYTYTGKIHTPTAIEDFTITIQSPTFKLGQETQRGNLVEMGGTFLATRGDQEYELDAAVDGLDVYIREDVLASLFQMDLDECELEDGTPVLMIVTDVMDLPSDAVIIEDSALPQPVNQEIEEGYSNEGEEPVNETDESYDEHMQAWVEERVQEYMNDWGLTEDEARATVEEVLNMAAESQAQMEQNRQEASEEFWKNHDAEVEAALAEQEAYFQERYGISIEEWDALSAKEQLEYAMTHPANS